MLPAAAGTDRSSLAARVLVGLAVVLVVVTAVVVPARRTIAERGGTRVPARGPFWRVEKQDGDLVEIDRKDPRVRLAAGARLMLDDEYAAAGALKSVRFLFSRNSDDTAFEVRIRDQGEATYRLVLGAKNAHAVTLLFEKVGSSPEQIARRADKEYVGRTGNVAEVEVALDGPRILVSIDGASVLDVTDDRLSDGAVTIGTRKGLAFLHALEVRGGAGANAEVLREDFQSVAGASTIQVATKESVPVVLALLLALLFARALCGASPGPRRLIASAALTLLPAALLMRLGFGDGEGPALLPLTVALFFGMLLGLIPLRGAIRGAEAPRGLSRVRVALVVLVTAATTGFAVANQRLDLHAKWLTEAVRAYHAPAAEAHDDSNPVVLDAASFATAPHDYRNFVFTAEVELASDSLLEIRTRSRSAEGIALLVSARADVASSFVLERSDAFEQISGDGPQVEPDRPLTVRIEARGERFIASFDGVPVAEASVRLFPAGRIVLLAASGEVRLSRWAVEPLLLDEPEPSLLFDRLQGGLSPLVGLLLLGLVVSWLLRTSWWRAIEIHAFGLIPVGLAFSSAQPGQPVGDTEALASAMGVALLIVFHAMTRAAETRVWRFYAVFGVSLACAGLCYQSALAPGWPTDFARLNAIPPTDWSGTRLSADLVHFQHPLSRRWDYYLVDHQIRGRTYPLKKPEKTVRILALGTSSTYGYGSDTNYPHLAGDELNEGRGGRSKVEVLNAGWPGSDGVRILQLFKNALIQFDPDIVTLSLSYNDSNNTTQFDLLQYFAEITAPEYERGYLTMFRERIRFAIQRRWQQILTSRHAAGDKDLLDSWDESLVTPPDRFSAMLRAFADLCEARSIRLVLIKEPMLGDRLFRDEYRAAMDTVGEERGLTVLHPEPALMAEGGASLFQDPVHLYGEGHQVMARFLVPHLRRELRMVEEARAR